MSTLQYQRARLLCPAVSERVEATAQGPRAVSPVGARPWGMHLPLTAARAAAVRRARGLLCGEVGALCCHFT